MPKNSQPAKKPTTRAKNTTKTLSITANNFVVHPLASKPYQIYCELFPIIKPKQNRRVVSIKTTLFDVIKNNATESQEVFYFFDDFASIALLEDKENITIRELDATAIDIKRRAWEYLLNSFLDLKPVKPVIFQAINNAMPPEIAKEIFGGKLTIEKVLTEMELERHRYDYRASPKRRHQVHNLPLFSDLLKEAQNGL